MSNRRCTRGDWRPDILDGPPSAPDRRPSGRHRPSHQGFTLLEVIVALAILGIAFALAVELLANGVRSSRASEEYTQATLLARQKMAEVAGSGRVETLSDAGEFGGGFRWISEIQPFPQEVEDLPARLYQVWVRVTWPGRRGEKALDLYTLRMAVDESKLQQTRVAPAPAPAR
ncbi:MAG: type IV pilus modification PilV family protein [Candidatus Methylomirabilaceae bacterium]